MKTYILAAGKGTRMNSELPKSLSNVDGKPLIFYSIENLLNAEIKDITIVVGYKADEVRKSVEEMFPKNSAIKFLEQKHLNGTGQAVLEIIEDLENSNSKDSENFMILNADDSLFYDPTDLKNIIESHLQKNSLVSLFLTEDFESRNYRKVYLDKNNNFDYFSKDQRADGFVVTGLYIFEKDFIKNFLIDFKKEVKEGEELKITDFMYLKDIKEKINIYIINNSKWFGINTQEELALANKLWQSIHK